MENCDFCAQKYGTINRLSLEGFRFDDEFLILLTICPNCQSNDTWRLPRIWLDAIVHAVFSENFKNLPPYEASDDGVIGNVGPDDSGIVGAFDSKD